MDRFVKKRLRSEMECEKSNRTLDGVVVSSVAESTSDGNNGVLALEKSDFRGHVEPENKKVKLHNQHYRPEYTQRWSFILPVDGDVETVNCTVCHSIVKVSHGGRYDIERHLLVKKHKRALEMLEQKKKLETFCSNKPCGSDSVESKTVLAESLFLKFLIEHNVPLSAADHAGHLFKRMFPDSKIASNYGSGRTKTTAISNVFGEEISSNLAKSISTQPYSLATDGSNDKGSETLYPIVIRRYNEEIGEIVTEMLTLAACKTSSTGEHIFNLLDRELSSRGIQWENCLSFGCDNANVMVGQHKGVAAFIHRKNPNVKVQGCPCHLLHLAAKAGTKKLSIDVDQVLIDIFYHFDKSTKRQQEFNSLCEETGDVVRKVLKHGVTRWLSLLRCVERLVEQFDALCQYFTALKVKGERCDRVRRLHKFFENPLGKTYCLFLLNTLPLFVDTNTFLQRDEPLLHVMQDKMLELLTELCIRFITPKAISSCSSLLDMDFNDKKLQKHRQDVVIGRATKEHLMFQKEAGKVTKEQESEFFSNSRHFFATACSYIVDKLPVNSELLAHAGVMSPNKRLNFKFYSLEQLMKAFPSVVREGVSLNTVESEFLKYQVDTLTPEILSCHRVDKAWTLIGKIENCEGHFKYKCLSAIMLSLLVVPHSNADCERVFSLVRKCKTEFRSSMSTNVLSNLIIQKVQLLSQKWKCYDVQISPDQLKLARGATKHHLSKSK